LSDSSTGSYDTISRNPKDNKKSTGAIRRNGTRANLNDEVLKHRAKMKTTPWLHRLVCYPQSHTYLNFANSQQARAYFAKNLAENDVSEGEGLEFDLQTHLQKVRRGVLHETRSSSFEGECIWEDEAGRKGYSCVDIDGVQYRPGDSVIVRSPGKCSRSKGHGLDSDIY